MNTKFDVIKKVFLNGNIKMSSISAKIEIISKAQPVKKSELLESICETMETSKLSRKETEQLCNVVTPLIYNESASISQSAVATVRKIIQSNEYPPNFPKIALIELKKTIGHHKRKPRNDALNMANDLMPIVTPEVFWDTMSDTLNETKNPYLKESALILFKQTLITFPDFKVKKYLKPIFAIFKDPKEIPRQHALQITKILYQRNPTDVEKLLRNQFSYEAEGIISKLKESNESDDGSVSSKSSKSRLAPTASYSAAQNAPFVNSNEEIEDELIKQFNDLKSDVEPDPSPCPFKKLETILKRSADWQDRMAGLQMLLAHARGTQNPSNFLREMRSIQDQYSECLSDPRSALAKESCIILVGLAQIFGSQLDTHSQWLISSILPKTGHGTFVIAKPAEMAVVKYVQYVQGKHIKNILLTNADNASQGVKVTVVRAMIVAKKFWSSSLSKEFDEILKKKVKNEKYKEVRDAAAAGIEGIRYINPNDPPSTVKKSKIPSFSRPTSSLSKAAPPEENDEKSVAGDDTVSVSEIGEVGVVQNSEEPPPENLESEDSVTTFIENKNTKGLLEFIKSNKPDLIGQMQNVIELIMMDLNDENGIEVAASLLKEICENYVKLLYPYINSILVDLPEDEKYGMECLGYLGSAIGELQLARLLRQSNLSYADTFILQVAEKMPTDINLQSSAVLNAIYHQQYEKHHLLIFQLIKNIYENSPTKCESLFMSMPEKDREEILDEYRYQIPEMYQAFYGDKRNDMPALLYNEVENAKKGKKIDFQLISDVPKNESSLLLLAIAAIRESPEFDPRFVDYLISLTETEDNVILGAVDEALKQRCETDPSCCLIIAHNFIPNQTAFNSFGRSIKYSNQNEAVEALLILKDQMIEGLQNVKTKFAVLSVLANAIKFIGDEYWNFCGKLSFANDSLLKMMILKINAQE